MKSSESSVVIMQHADGGIKINKLTKSTIQQSCVTIHT